MKIGRWTAPGEASTSRPGERRPRILVVDDDPATLGAMADLLRAPGREVFEASSGGEALRRLLELDVAVILLDVRMPGLDGFETATLIRQRERTRETPIIFVTGAPSDAEQIGAAYATGAVDYVLKPIQPAILKRKVDVFVELNAKNLQLQRLTDELERSRGNLQVALDCADGLVVVDRWNRALYLNPAAEGLFGRSAAELLGDPFPHPLARPGRYDIALDERTGQGAVELNTVEIDWDGQPAYLSTVRDVTYRRRVEQELTARTEELETLFRVVSHDFKAPVRHVRALTAMLREDHAEALPPAGLDLLGRLEEAGARMHALLEDLTLLARARASADRGGSSSAREVVDRVLADLAGPLEESGASVEVGPLPGRLPLDGGWAAHALRNLVENALKFTAPGQRPEVEVAGYGGADDEEVGLVVRDRGLGVPPDQVERIFLLYRRAAPAGVPGSGVGLAIVRQIASHHGGRAWVEEREGGGSEFVVTFRAPERAGTRRTTRPGAHAANGSGENGAE